ncbi:MAG: hypothetical protein IRZ24_17090 [Thermogemmatispora sp.]|nr:hypothetical protein [Thermogemmatispora sp.]
MRPERLVNCSLTTSLAPFLIQVNDGTFDDALLISLWAFAGMGGMISAQATQFSLELLDGRQYMGDPTQQVNNPKYGQEHYPER